MDLTWGIALAAAWLTWVVFAVGMRACFRGARKVTPAKTWLIRCGALCTLAQLAALAWWVAPAALAGVGVGGYALALTLYGWALATHGRDRPAFAFLPSAPAALKTAGPYRYVRHPIYAAYLLAWVAGALVTGQPWLLAAPVLMGAFYRRAACEEEQQFLDGPLAAEYLAYRRRTGMFLPRLRQRAAL